MKQKKSLARITSCLLICCLCLLLTACAEKDKEATEAAPENPLGIYTLTQDYDDVGSRLVGTHAMRGERETVGQLSAITVYSSETAIQLDENNNAVKDEKGEIIHVENNDENNVFYKYIFSKNSIVAGESFLVYSRGQYTGYCTYDAKTGELTMYTPEYYMTYTTNRDELDSWEGEAVNTKVTDEVLAESASGMNFSSEWQDFFGYTRPEPLTVTLTDDLQFNFVSQYLSDDSGMDNSYSYQFIDFSDLYPYGTQTQEENN